MAWWLMPRTPDPEVGGSSPTRVKPCCVYEQSTFTPQKVLVIPRKRWLGPNMTGKLFTGTLRINQPTKLQGRTIHKVPPYARSLRKCLKTLGFANVNEWIIVIDPSNNCTERMFLCDIFLYIECLFGLHVFVVKALLLLRHCK